MRFDNSVIYTILGILLIILVVALLAGWVDL